MQQRLRSEPEVGPLLTVDPRCENTIREFESYEWMGDKESQADKPRKENDHAMDALRYAVTHVDGLGAGVTLDVFDSNKGEFLRDLELAFGEDDD